MDDNTQILDLIQDIFNSKFDALDKKLDLITQGLEKRVTTMEVTHATCDRRTSDKLNIGNEVIKTLIHWGIPITILAIIYFIQQGKLNGL